MGNFERLLGNMAEAMDSARKIKKAIRQYEAETRRREKKPHEDFASLIFSAVMDGLETEEQRQQRLADESMADLFADQGEGPVQKIRFGRRKDISDRLEKVQDGFKKVRGRFDSDFHEFDSVEEALDVVDRLYAENAQLRKENHVLKEKLRRIAKTLGRIR